MTRVLFAGEDGGHVLVSEFRGMTLNGLFCADVLRPLDLVPSHDFIYKYHLDQCDSTPTYPAYTDTHCAYPRRVGEAELPCVAGTSMPRRSHNGPCSVCCDAVDRNGGEEMRSYAADRQCSAGTR